MPYQCDQPLHACLSSMLSGGLVALVRESTGAGSHVKVIWFHEKRGRIEGHGANIEDAVADCIEKSSEGHGDTIMEAVRAMYE